MEMAISDSFRSWADGRSDVLNSETGEEMKEKGFIFLEWRSVGDLSEIPNVSWHSLVHSLGGQMAIEADYDGKDTFRVKHIESGVEVTSNGAVAALANLWLALNT